jgi:hypothetical protein
MPELIIILVIILIIFGIAGAWAAFLLPSIFSFRRSSPVDSAREFEILAARLNTVGRRPGPGSALTKRRVMMRRRRALISLIVLAVVTLAVAIWLQSIVLLVVHLAVDAVIAWFVSMLIQIRQRREAQFVVDISDEAIHEPVEPQVRIVASS